MAPIPVTVQVMPSVHSLATPLVLSPKETVHLPGVTEAGKERGAEAGFVFRFGRTPLGLAQVSFHRELHD